MPSFSDLFQESKDHTAIYKGNKIYWADKFPVTNGDILIANIESTNSEKRQGFSIDITGFCEMDRKIFKRGKGVKMLFWEDTFLHQVSLKIHTKKDFVWIQNIWENINTYLVSNQKGEPIKRQSKSVESGHNGAAMIVEEIENGRRYRCNDGKPDDDFDDIVFTVRKLKA